MEDDVGPLAHNMLLMALVVLGLAIAAKLAARGRYRRRRTAPAAGSVRDPRSGDPGWTAEVPRGRAAASKSNDHNEARGERTSADYRDYYAEETRRLVAEHFREEIERFRYSFG